MAGEVRLELSQGELRVTPGERSSVVATVRNDSDTPDTYTISVEPPEAGWCTASTWTVSVSPGDEAQIELSFSVPAASDVVPGEYYAGLRVVSKRNPAQEAAGQVVLRVGSHVDFDVELVPVSTVKGAGRYRLDIINRSKETIGVAVVGDEEGGRWDFDIDSPIASVEAGGGASIAVTVTPKRRSKIGLSRECRFGITVKGSAGGGTVEGVKMVSGHLRCPPVLGGRTLVGGGVVMTAVLLAVLLPLLLGSGDGEAPTVTISVSPSAPSEGEVVTFVANADAEDLGGMEIVVNGETVAECTGSPCEYAGGPYPAGTVTYRVVAWDRTGNRNEGVTASVGIMPAAVDSVGPTVHVEALVEGDRVTVTGDASDESGIEEIILLVKVGASGDWVDIETCASPTCSFSGGPFPIGPISCRAKARDTEGNEATSEAIAVEVTKDETPPEVELAVIPSNPTSADLVTFAATATDVNGVERIEVYIDYGHLLTECSNSPCSRTWGPFNAGEQDIWAFAWDAEGNRGGSGRATLVIRE